MNFQIQMDFFRSKIVSKICNWIQIQMKCSSKMKCLIQIHKKNLNSTFFEKWALEFEFSAVVQSLHVNFKCCSAQQKSVKILGEIFFEVLKGANFLTWPFEGTLKSAYNFCAEALFFSSFVHGRCDQTVKVLIRFIILFQNVWSMASSKTKTK